MPVWLTVFLALGGSAAIGLVVNDLYQAIKQNSHKYKQLRKEEKQREMAEVFDAKLKPLEEKIDKSLGADILTLRCSMKSLRERCVKQKFADAGDKGTMRELYTKYKELGGNHFKEYVDVWLKDVVNLPNEKKVSK